MFLLRLWQLVTGNAGFPYSDESLAREMTPMYGSLECQRPAVRHAPRRAFFFLMPAPIKRLEYPIGNDTRVLAHR